MPEEIRVPARIAAWLSPIEGADAPCGKDLEYDSDFLQLVKAAQGVPETQFSAAEPPNWRAVLEAAEGLLSRSRDLRIAVLWVRASVSVEGFFAFVDGLALMEGLLTQHWEHLHPLPDAEDGDTYARANAVAVLPQADGLLGDLRQCVLFNLRGVGELRVRSVALSLGLIAAKPDEAVLGKEQLIEMIAEAHRQTPEMRERLEAALLGLERLGTVMRDRLGVLNVPDIRPLQTLVKGVHGLFPVEPQAAEPEEPQAHDGAAAPAPKAAAAGQLAGQVLSRTDALRAIEMVCDYLDRAEPGNPAQLLLRRAARLINQNFLQLMKELAPDALNEVAKLMGIDPHSVG